MSSDRRRKTWNHNPRTRGNVTRNVVRHSIAFHPTRLNWIVVRVESKLILNVCWDGSKAQRSRGNRGEDGDGAWFFNAWLCLAPKTIHDTPDCCTRTVYNGRQTQLFKVFRKCMTGQTDQWTRNDFQANPKSRSPCLVALGSELIVDAFIFNFRCFWTKLRLWGKIKKSF